MILYDAKHIIKANAWSFLARRGQSTNNQNAKYNKVFRNKKQPLETLYMHVLNGIWHHNAIKEAKRKCEKKKSFSATDSNWMRTLQKTSFFKKSMLRCSWNWTSSRTYWPRRVSSLFANLSSYLASSPTILHITRNTTSASSSPW